MKKNFTYMARMLQSAAMFFSFALLISQSADAQPVTQTFTSSGTYTVPLHYAATVTIEVWGGGGAGGGGGTGNGSRYGGGGGGYARFTTLLNPGNYTVTVGTGGAATTSNVTGASGGASSFASLVSATGGSGGSSSTAGAGGAGTAGAGITTHTGGSGGARNNNNSGGGGGGGSSPSPSTNGTNGGNAPNPGTTGGAGGTLLNGGTGGNGGNNNGTGANGVSFGGGGGGKGDGGSISGSGANGKVVITVTGLQSPLPLKFGDFKAYQKQSGVQLDWNTFTEINVSHFEIERSSDGINFSNIGQVSAKNLNIRSDYNWFDATPLNGNNFYRIKSVDLDGKKDYTAIVKINLGKTFTGINIYPNPVIGKQITFQASDMQSGIYMINIYDNLGQQLYKQSFSHSGGAISQSIQLPASMKAGMYNMVVVSGDSKTSRPFIVQ